MPGITAAYTFNVNAVREWPNASETTFTFTPAHWSATVASLTTKRFVPGVAQVTARAFGFQGVSDDQGEPRPGHKAVLP
jgi:hypothetical protein